MTPVLMAAESAMDLSWPDAVMLSVLFVCVAAVVIYFLHVLAKPDSRVELVERKPPEWRSETTVTRPNPSDPRPREKGQ